MEYKKSYTLMPFEERMVLSTNDYEKNNIKDIYKKNKMIRESIEMVKEGLDLKVIEKIEKKV